jgi:hypothetical protein
MYQIVGKDVVYAWLEREPNADFRQAFLEWLANLAIDPINERASRVPGVLAPVYVQIVALGRRLDRKHVVFAFSRSARFHSDLRFSACWVLLRGRDEPINSDVDSQEA